MDIRKIDLSNLNLPQQVKYSIKKVKEQLRLLDRGRHQSSQELPRSDYRLQLGSNNDPKQVDQRSCMEYSSSNRHSKQIIKRNYSNGLNNILNQSSSL